jgi:hypothetical protein
MSAKPNDPNRLARQVPSEVMDLLRASQVPWELKLGGKHIKLMIANRLACVFPRGSNHRDAGCQRMNVMASIRRALRQPG